MDNALFDNIPKAIAEASKSPLGMAALTIVVLAILAAVLFRHSEDRVKILIYMILVSGCGVLLFQILKTHDEIDKTALGPHPSTGEEKRSQSENSGASTSKKGDATEQLRPAAQEVGTPSQVLVQVSSEMVLEALNRTLTECTDKTKLVTEEGTRPADYRSKSVDVYSVRLGLDGETLTVFEKARSKWLAKTSPARPPVKYVDDIQRNFQVKTSEIGTYQRERIPKEGLATFWSSYVMTERRPGAPVLSEGAMHVVALRCKDGNESCATLRGGGIRRASSEKLNVQFPEQIADSDLQEEPLREGPTPFSSIPIAVCSAEHADRVMQHLKSLLGR